MMKKVIISVFIFFAGILIISCHKEKVKDIWIKWCVIPEFTYVPVSQNGIGEWGDFNNMTRLDTLDSISYSKFGLFLNGWRNKQVIYEQTQGYVDEGPSYYPLGNITNIEIYSDSNYNSSHPSNELLNDIFMISYSYTIRSDKKDELPANLNDYLKTSPQCRFYLYFLIKIPPENDSYHRFRIIYKDTEGNSFNMIFPQIKILKK